jgi:hypothetical protein
MSQHEALAMTNSISVKDKRAMSKRATKGSGRAGARRRGNRRGSGCADSSGCCGDDTVPTAGASHQVAEVVDDNRHAGTGVEGGDAYASSGPPLTMAAFEAMVAAAVWRVLQRHKAALGVLRARGLSATPAAAKFVLIEFFSGANASVTVQALHWARRQARRKGRRCHTTHTLLDGIQFDAYLATDCRTECAALRQARDDGGLPVHYYRQDMLMLTDKDGDACPLVKHLRQLAAEGYTLLAHASPPCNTSSLANQEKTQAQVDASMRIVEAWHTLATELGMLFVCENPSTSQLWIQPFAEQHLPHRIVLDYCTFGPGLKKETVLASNCPVLLDYLAIQHHGVLCKGVAWCKNTSGCRHVEFKTTTPSERQAIVPALAQLITSALWHMGAWSCKLQRADHKLALEQQQEQHTHDGPAVTN